MTRRRILIGREPELEEIRGALERAAGGEGSLLLLVGEPGIGKTTLADHAAGEARARGFAALWGRCWEGEAPPAYLPWTQLLRATPPPAAALASALAPVLPELGPGSADPEAAGFRLLEAVLEHLDAAAASRPHLLILDDLHAADAGSLRVLELVARSLRGRPLLVLGLYRDVEARLAPDAARLLGRISREGRSLRLRRLDANETTALAEATAGRALPAPVVREVVRATEGNPLFVAETVELLAASGELAMSDLSRGSALPIPSGVEEVIRGRLTRLSGPARRALEVASVLGRELDTRLAHSLLAAEGIADPEAALAEAEALGFGAPAGPERFRLSHAMVRDAIYGGLPLANRRALHLAASRLFEASVEGASLEAAHHALAALPDGGAARAVALAARAAEEQARRLAFEGAAEMYERALRALPVVPADRLRRCDLLIALARCRMSSGAVAEAKARALEASALARAAEDGRRLGQAALAYGSEIRIAVVDPVLVGLLEEAAATLPPDDLTLRPLVLARLAAARQPAADPAVPAALAREAIALARRQSDPDVLVRTLHAALAAMVDYVPARERLPLSTELSRLALARGERGVAMHASARAFIDRLELGEVSAADVELARLDGLAREVGHPRYLWRPLLMKAMRAAMSGRWDEADRLRAEALALGAGTEDPNLPVVHAVQGYMFALERGPLEEIRATGARMAELMAGFSGAEAAWPTVFTTIGLVRGGLFDEARSEWSRLPTEMRDIKGELLLLTLAAEIAAVLRSERHMAWLEPALRAWAGYHVTIGQMGLTWLGPVDRVLGLLAAARGARDEAAAALGRAREAAVAAGATPTVARIDAELAALAGQAGAPSRPRAPAPPAAPLTLIAEGDVWVLARAGRTVRVRATRGMAMLARLCAEPGRELHALDLGGAGEPGVDTGDAGEVLDRQARDAYRDRYTDLEETIAEAEALGDGARAARARAEREALADELARGLGLGGRARRAGAAAERARVNVQRRLKDALERVAAADPDLGRHLARTVKTGTFCSYDPAQD